MRRIALWFMSTLTVLVLLFSYRTSTSSVAATTAQVAGSNGVGASTGLTPSPTAASTATATSATPSSSATAATTPTATPTSSAAAAQSGTAKTYDGDAVMTRFGNVQVQITVQDGKITAAQVLQVPWNDRHDQQINSYAVPILNQETVAAQSSGIDMVSGATVTSGAYIQSLQSALDQAHL